MVKPHRNIDELMAAVLRELDAYNQDPTAERRRALREAARRLHPNVGDPRPRLQRPANAGDRLLYRGRAIGDLIRLLDDPDDP